ncbi:hypothetical protein BZM27_16095 [Paraburkholderia steynii]|uniref:VOC domain-containing protein n=1 Tax=Paraburkholderia steynii TaxID=1245441 RepID=A0A4R0XKG2_9BURK|nr:hypothetical protein BZM27_16095 [Paraburkholderia steynii]
METFVENTMSIMPLGLSHIVLHVRNIEESHRFWTEVVGLRHVGSRGPTPEQPNALTMRFYVGDRGENKNHHDVALIEMPMLPAPTPESPASFHHLAIAFPGRQPWLDHLAYLQQRGIEFERRVEHGMTHSLYIRDPNGYGIELLYDMPKEVWEDDLNAALNYLEDKPTAGPAALEDRVDGIPVFTARP